MAIDGTTGANSASSWLTDKADSEHPGTGQNEECLLDGSPGGTGKRELSAAHHSKGARDATNKNSWKLYDLGQLKRKAKNMDRRKRK